MDRVFTREESTCECEFFCLVCLSEVVSCGNNLRKNKFNDRSIFITAFKLLEHDRRIGLT